MGSSDASGRPATVYERRVVVPWSFAGVALLMLGILAWFLPQFDEDSASPWLAVGFAVVVAAVPLLTLWPRAFRSVRVDAAGVHVAGQLVAPADRIIAVVPLTVPKLWSAQKFRSGGLGAYTTALGIDTPRDGHPDGIPVAVPLDHDHSNTGGAATPGVLVVLDTHHPAHEQLAADPLHDGVILTSWTPRRLADAVVTIAPGVDTTEPLPGVVDVPLAEQYAQQLLRAWADAQRTRRP